MAGQCSWSLVVVAPRAEAGAGCRPYPEVPFGVWPGELRFSPDGRRLGLVDEGVAVWDAADGRLLKALTFDDGPWSMVFSPDGSEIVVSTFGCDLMAISTSTWKTSPA